MKFLLTFVCVALFAGQSLAELERDLFAGLGKNLYENHKNFKYIDFHCGFDFDYPYPWIVMLVHSNPETHEKYSCAGLFVSNATIVTTARCVSKRGKLDK